METSKRIHLQRLASEKGAVGHQRFIVELEFVECLANPRYLQYLAQHKLLDDECFINYIDYLQYWRDPEYIQYISHPHCLFFLELLQKKEFRDRLQSDASYVEMIFNNQYWHWRYFQNNRYMEKESSK